VLDWGIAAIGHALFDTNLGRCGIAWSRAGVLRLQLPEPDDDAVRARLLRAGPASEAEPPAEVTEAIEGVTALLAGAPRDLRAVVLDMSAVSAWEQRVYAALREVGPGETVTYGELARRLGEPGAAQAVGRAMARNPFAPVVPCHRVLAAGGGTGGFSAAGGATTKVRLLELEGAAAPARGLFADLPLAVRP
jgi:methylated-DNA-[protein]-cysteine S-methyltransferase